MASTDLVWENSTADWLADKPNEHSEYLPIAIYLALGRPEEEGDRAVDGACASQEIKAPSFPHSIVLIVLLVDESVAAQVTCAACDNDGDRNLQEAVRPLQKNTSLLRSPFSNVTHFWPRDAW